MKKAGRPLGLAEAVNQMMTLFGFDDLDNKAAQYEYLRSGSLASEKQFITAQELLSFAMSFRLLLDLEDQNLYTCPSLEKLGLLGIEFDGLEEAARIAPKLGTDLMKLPESARVALMKAFLNELRRIECIDTRYFRFSEQHAAREKDNNLLSSRWSLFADDERDLTQGQGATFDEVLAKKRGARYRYLSAKSQIIRRLTKLPEIKALPPEVLRNLARNPCWRTPLLTLFRTLQS